LASRVINKKIEQVAIDLLKHHPRNANNGDVEAIKKSLAVNGWYGSVVANLSTKHILAGNHRVMAAKALGWETVPVQWVDVTPEEELRILVVDNRTTRIGQDDTTKITDILAELANTPIGLDGTGYGAADLDALIDELAGMTDSAELLTDPDEVPEEVETRCKPGDLWILGRHRLLCGDSTKADDVARLMDGARADCMWTDPPYGVSYVGKTNKSLTIENDGEEGLPSLLQGAFSCATMALALGAPFYIAHPPGKLSIMFGNAILAEGWRFHQTLIWCKDSMVLGHSDYHYRHEPIYYGWTQGEGRSGRGHHDGTRWHGDNSQVSVFHVDRPKRSEEHPTSKPVALIEIALMNSTKENETVYEPFCGSGSTLIACESMGRLCFALELSPSYCDVIIQRWENATGQKAVLSEG